MSGKTNFFTSLRPVRDFSVCNICHLNVCTKIAHISSRYHLYEFMKLVNNIRERLEDIKSHSMSLQMELKPNESLKAFTCKKVHAEFIQHWKGAKIGKNGFSFITEIT